MKGARTTLIGNSDGFAYVAWGERYPDESGPTLRSENGRWSQQEGGWHKTNWRALPHNLSDV